MSEILSIDTQQLVFDALEHHFPEGFEPPDPAAASPSNYAEYVAWCGPDPLSESEMIAVATETRARRERHVLVRASRDALRAKWADAPAWIRGPYHAQFESAAAMLDARDYDAAEAIIELASAMPGYDAEQIEAFEDLQAELLDDIGALRILDAD